MTFRDVLRRFWVVGAGIVLFWEFDAVWSFYVDFVKFA